MTSKNIIKCPNCSTAIDIDEIFYHQIEEKLEHENREKKKQLTDKLKHDRQRYEEEKAALQNQREKFDEELHKATKASLKQERVILQEQIKNELQLDQSESIAKLNQELKKKSEQIIELNSAKAEIEKLKREKLEALSVAKLQAQQDLSNELEQEKKKLHLQAEQANKKLLSEVEKVNELALKAKDEKIAQMAKSIEDARRKSEQGSMQIQGESMESVIESWLTSQFPFDSIEEVKKGAFGADCIQVIHTRELQNCGVICYESKNTKAWSESWLSKLKQDMLKVNANLGVLITSIYPNGMSRMGFVDGIWVCSLEEFKGASSLLRDSLIRVHQTAQKEDNKSDKMTLLYNYLTGNEFNMQLKAIVDGFITMQNELDKERRSLMASWKRRQKLIDGVLQNTTEMYGSLQGIAGPAALAQIEALELPNQGDEDSN